MNLALSGVRGGINHRSLSAAYVTFDASFCRKISAVAGRVFRELLAGVFVNF